MEETGSAPHTSKSFPKGLHDNNQLLARSQFVPNNSVFPTVGIENGPRAHLSRQLAHKGYIERPLPSNDHFQPHAPAHMASDDMNESNLWFSQAQFSA